ncbi:hypothetical protein BOTBODRAFT_44609 [Botryobasidium botryosum FD-172 SS1]|uniref:Uncharacterized protein n=1 Tax=Botryobasidium botryosum (strain FD-172 SS1) TaxID=930990 RepID=A0A067MIF0_BOTB1|nr:hypothetical protein BOTBODRAFT_44609 [Botryobasidium botryosum FD-172 SS1]
MLGKGASTAAISHPRLTPTISTESASTTGSARPLMSYSPCEWRDIHPFHDDRRRSDSDRPASINMFSFPFAAPRPSADVPSRESLPLPWRPREFINRVLGRPPNRVSHARAGSSPPDLHISTKSSFGGSRPSSPLVRPASACETEWDAVDRPPTTNVLSTSERNELLRKNRKLQQVLGETPVPLPFVGGNDVSSYRLQLERLPLSQRRHSYTSPPPPLSWHDQTHSYPIAISPPTPNEMAQTIVHGRRPRPLSSPASPAFFGSFDHPYSPRNNIIDYDQPSTPPFTPMPNKGQEVEFPNAEQTNAMYTVPSPHSLSSFTSTEGSSIAMGYEPEPTSPTHAQKRAKLAKIHRFLGSRVPPHLVLGLPQPLEEALARDLPDPAPEPRTETRRASGNWGEKQGDNRDSWWALWEENEREGGAGGGSGDGDVELRLTGEQRAQCVKRKVKMEKMFGALPPQTLYQPRPPAAPQSQHDDDESYDEKGALSDAASGMSPQYLQHRTSLLSLAMIVESNDKKSLTRMLACYQSGDDDQESLLSSSDSEIDFEDAMEEGSHAHIPRRPSNPGGVRRRSNYSMEQAPTISHAYGSAYAGDWVEPSPDPAEALPIDFNALGFQQRRRRAEKLQRIFGVDYRTLFKEVLDNIENEVKDDRSRGVLSSAELQELLAKLKSLESKRYEPIFDQ